VREHRGRVGYTLKSIAYSTSVLLNILLYERGTLRRKKRQKKFDNALNCIYNLAEVFVNEL
jgi:hypothetical protein